MGNVRGLRTRLCHGCNEITPHRTLYMRTESGGKTSWLQLFWACAKCGSLNHIVLPAYRLDRVCTSLPSALAVNVVHALKRGPLDLDELIMRLRGMKTPDVRHVFNADVMMALEFLKGHSVVTEEQRDRTASVLGALPKRTTKSRLQSCPAEVGQNGETSSLLPLYAQSRVGLPNGRRLFLVGVFCPGCNYRRIDISSATESQ